MTAPEVARRLGKSLATVKRYARAGKLPVILKVPGATGAYLFDRAAIE
ncbi:Helix-turn-helix domain containing protein, partial [uncultured Caudovirales phage]